MNKQEAETYLKEDGWKYSESGSRFAGTALWYKQFDTQTSCNCNYNKKGIQICCSIHERPQNFGLGFELEICAELMNGTWVKFMLYSLPEDLGKALERIPILLAAWEAANE